MQNRGNLRSPLTFVRVFPSHSIAVQVVKQAWLNKRGHMMKGYRQKRRYFVLTRCGYLHFFPNKWCERRRCLQHAIVTSFRSAEPLASIWLQPCSILLDPKEKCGFKIQVSVVFCCAFNFDAWCRCKLSKGQERKFLTIPSWFSNARARLSVTIGYVR